MARAEGNSGSGTPIISIDAPADFEIVNGRLEIVVDGTKRAGRLRLVLSMAELDNLKRFLRGR
jgi:hypothetical protein